MSRSFFSPGGIACLACLLEVSAPKPGNVHRLADFEDVTFDDFATSAVVLGQVIDDGAQQPAGELILNAVERTREVVGSNTNLGIILAIVPLAKIVCNDPTVTLGQTVVADYLATLDQFDGANLFEAIRLAHPGGLGESREFDVRSTASEQVDLRAAMESAADRDAIAKLYVTGFRDVFEFGVPSLIQGRTIFGKLNQAIVYAHVAWMASQPDSLIVRKCGMETAQHSQILASQAIDCLQRADPNGDDPIGSDERDRFWAAVGELDFWLRSDGHRRNPGTTADLIAASLFVAIQNKSISPPFR